MKKVLSLSVIIILMMMLLSCGNSSEDVVSKAEYDAVTSKLSRKNEELQRQLESVQAELDELKRSIEENEKKQTSDAQVEEMQEEKEEGGFTTATDPITVPDPDTQSEFVVEVTAENFLSIFEFVAIDQYNTWGEYSYKLGGFSSLLYEQGWAIGTLEDFAVEYAVFDYAKVTSLGVTASKTHFPTEKDTEIGLRIHRAKGTLTCYPIESVEDTYYEYEDYQFIKRILPDGSEVWIETDKEGIMVY